MHALARNWWMVLVRGIVALLFGIAVAARPAAGLVAIIVMFGIYAFMFGIFAVGAGIFGGPQRRWEVLLEGIVAILAGVITFSRPGITAVALYATIAVFAIITGILEIVSAARLRHQVDGSGWLVASGIVSILFGVLLVARPMAGALAIAFLIAAYGIILGITFIALSLRLRRVAHREPRPMVPTMRTPQPA